MAGPAFIGAVDMVVQPIHDRLDALMGPPPAPGGAPDVLGGILGAKFDALIGPPPAPGGGPHVLGGILGAKFDALMGPPPAPGGGPHVLGGILGAKLDALASRFDAIFGPAPAAGGAAAPPAPILSRIAALEAANAGAAAAAAGAPVHAAHLAAFIRSVNEGLADPEAAYTVMPGANGLTPPAHWPATGLSRWSLGALTGAALRDLLADFALPAVAEGVGVELRRRNAIAAHIGARLF